MLPRSNFATHPVIAAQQDDNGNSDRGSRRYQKSAVPSESITPALPLLKNSLSHMMDLTKQLADAQNEIERLKQKVKEMERMQSLIGNLSVDVGATQVKTLMTPKRLQMSATPQTPSTPESCFMLTPSPRRKHVRTKTPEQRSLHHITGGLKLFTIGMEPQENRGLIADFFDEIKRWAVTWTYQSPEETSIMIAAMANVVKEENFLVNATNILPVVLDKTMRVELVAAMVAHDIVYHTMTDHFLYNSGHPCGTICDKLLHKFAQYGPHQNIQKHENLVRQSTIYTKIQNDWNFHNWRDSVSQGKSLALIHRLGPLLYQGTSVQGLDGMLAHYTKGYRIGFRMRMDAKKWVLSWPEDGEKFCPITMVNETRTLCGSVNRTHHNTRQFPEKFTLRFGRSPTMTKHDFSYQTEVKEGVHMALVQLSHKMRHVGAETRHERSSRNKRFSKTSRPIYADGGPDDTGSTTFF